VAKREGTLGPFPELKIFRPECPDGIQVAISRMETLSSIAINSVEKPLSNFQK
jgi:hypothetical protein